MRFFVEAYISSYYGDRNCLIDASKAIEGLLREPRLYEDFSLFLTTLQMRIYH